LQKTGFLGSMPDVADLSENFKEHLDWSANFSGIV
jgi:hypothetical protein